MTVTSVTGHLMEIDFPAPFNKNWYAMDPGGLFDLDVHKQVPEKNQEIKRTLEREMIGCNWLVLWLDCDREGENISYEVIEVCRGVKKNFKISRARFADVNPASLERAIQNLVEPNEADSLAVDCRQELDLRLGAIFTRFQALNLQKRFPELKEDGQVLSYGPCQFPTLGFVVDRFWRVKAFIPEPFWYISCTVAKEGDQCELSWSRDRLFDQNICAAIFETLMDSPNATVTSLQTKPTSKWRPFPLSTVELQKKASKTLRLSAQKTMQIAENLYQKGFLSYPRTETEAFPEGTDFPALLAHQANHPVWGRYTQQLQNGGFRHPKRGKGDDKSHPPIHPTKSGAELSGDDARVYEFVTRHFLACCSEDAKGMETVATFQIAQETFSATGVMILERNFLDIYPYVKWETKLIPQFTQGERILPVELNMLEGSTSAPSYMTEEELVSLMDKNGIGTDATIAEHIHKVQERNYVYEENRELKPTKLGEALVAGYNAIQLQVLAKPELRAQTEADVKSIAEQRKRKEEVLRENIEAYRAIYQHMVANVPTLIRALSRYYQPGQGNDGAGGGPDDNNGGGGGFGGFSSPVLKCPECSLNMILKMKQDKTGYFISCVGYPSCKKSLWLPRELKEAKVTDEVCAVCSARHSNCGEIRKLDITLDKGAVMPGMPTSFRTCIGGCDDGFNEYLRSDRSYSERWFTKGSMPPPSTSSTTKKTYNTTKSTNGISYSNSNSMSATVTTSWDGSVTPSSRNHVASSKKTPAKNRQYDDDGGDGDEDGGDESDDEDGASQGNNGGQPMCLCGIPAKPLTVRKEGPNTGREFFGCGQSQKVCNFFVWANEVANTGGTGYTPQASGGRKGRQSSGKKRNYTKRKSSGKKSDGGRVLA